MLPYNVRSQFRCAWFRWLRLAGVAAVASVLLGAVAYAVWLWDGPRSVDRAVVRLNYEAALRAVDAIYAAQPAEHRLSIPLIRHADPPLSDVADELRITEDGVFLPTRRAFVQEHGLFIARPGQLPARSVGGDPSLVRLKERLYRYRISG